MIDPQSVELSSLPFVVFENRSQLPVSHGIYFAIDSQRKVQYIGSATGKDGLRQRWASTSHHKYLKLNEIGGICIAYLELDLPVELVLQIEEKLIDRLKPPLNQMPRVWRKVPSIKRKSETLYVYPSPPSRKDDSIKSFLSFGQWLKLMRDRCDIPQAKIAETLNVKKQTVSNWENGKSIPSLTPEQTRLLCNLLEVSLDTLAKAFRGEVEIND